MIRAPLGDEKYWSERLEKRQAWLDEAVPLLEQPSRNPTYQPQFALNVSKEVFRLIMTKYSAGKPIAELGRHFGPILDAWELSNRLAEEVCAANQLETCRDWSFQLSNLNHYNWCFWLLGLALALEVCDDEWERLIALIGAEGEDMLIDSIIATRKPQRIVGKLLLHAKPYARLRAAIEAPSPAQGELLRDFVSHWYDELERKGDAELWWYVFGDAAKHPLKLGSYFGRWCLEAVAAVKAFGLDDRLCLSLQHYPADLVHPETTTEARAPAGKNWALQMISKIFKV
ncbi:PoNe immunity protein domain-containing protein [Herbaspirillum seropedicae]|uniref:PoNe immunity protein domain-containing protein n=1 Tax=Herbaspirillum seropedicae TaxID=964 RepID=UPI003FCD33F5